MAFDKDEVTQLNQLFTKQGQLTAELLDAKLQPIKQELADIKQKLEKLMTMETEDIEASYASINVLKTKMRNLERRIAALER